MRLFVGVELDEASRSMAARVAAQLREDLGSGLRASWVPPENYHLTVRFIGHVPDDRAPAILDALAPPIHSSPFDVTLAGCGSFPPRGPARVLWIGVTQGLASLAALHDELDRRLAPFGFEPEKRPFSAHLTLARLKDTGRTHTGRIAEILRSVPAGPVAFHVARTTVFESRLSPKGSTYHYVRHSELRTADC
jgi:2'-5' RNA ligase